MSNTFDVFSVSLELFQHPFAVPFCALFTTRNKHSIWNCLKLIGQKLSMFSGKRTFRKPSDKHLGNFIKWFRFVGLKRILAWNTKAKQTQWLEIIVLHLKHSGKRPNRDIKTLNASLECVSCTHRIFSIAHGFNANVKIEKPKCTAPSECRASECVCHYLFSSSM